ncbi:MAG: hypothetical protein M1821_004602 [Bathelium mastoideum]|nr:MAG: hypothetical protein M1821_004602 [Bathelium mastoideum]
MASFDSNMWYQMTEVHVGFGSVLTNWGGNVTGFQAWNTSNEAQFWQIMTFQGDSSDYVFRNKAAGTLFALGVAFVPQEIDPSRTEPRLQTINSNNNGQKWHIGDFGNNTYYIANVGNGTSYHLDVHPGNPVYLSSQTSAEPYDPRQHWEFQSIMPIDDSQWSQNGAATHAATSAVSTTLTIATVSRSNATPTAASSGSGAPTNALPRPRLSVGVAVATGIGSAMAFMFFICVLHFHLRRYWTNRKNGPTQVRELSAECGKVELPNEERGKVELPQEEREIVELPGGEREEVESPDRSVPEYLN